MEAIIVLVGYLGAGKTTFLKRLVEKYVQENWQPNIILNDYQNANIDSQQFLSFLPKDKVQALSGSCICCSGVAELRRQVNKIPVREKGVTFIEANGTTDSCALMEFLCVGLNEHFLPPVQISIVDVRNWQKRGCYNELEANQVQVSSLIVLSHMESVDKARIEAVKANIREFNPSASIQLWESVDLMLLHELKTSTNKAEKMDHQKAHWSSCSVDLPDPMSSQHLKSVIDALPESIMRVKGCTKLDKDSYYSFFERIPSGETMVRPYRGSLVTGPKLLTIGPGSDPQMLQTLIEDAL